MDLSTTTISEKMDQYLSTAYQTLSREYIFFSLAIVMACIILPVFSIRILGKYERRQAEKEGKLCRVYLFKSTSNLKFHYTISVVLLVLAVRRLFRSIRLVANSEIYGIGIICCGLLLLLFAFLSIINLLKFRSRGLIMTGIFVVCFMAYRQYLRLQDANTMLQQAADYNVIVKYAIYPMIDYVVTSSMMMSMLVLIFILCTTFYYYRRRFLFMPGKLDMPRCKICGNPISKGDNFCICCGTNAWVNPIVQKAIPLDKEKYCKKCGKVLGELGCLKCGGAGQLEEYGRNKLKDKRKGIIRGAVFALFIFAVLYIPIAEDVTAGLQKGSAEVNNVFVKS